MSFGASRALARLSAILVPATLLLAATPPDVRVESGLVINAGAGYSFTLPAGWVMKEPSDSRVVTVQDPGSTAVVTVRFEPASRDGGNPLTTALLAALKSESNDFEPDATGMGPTRLGGETAMGARGVRTGPGGAKEMIRCLVTEREGPPFSTLSLTAVASEADAPKAERQIDSVLKTFKFGKPKKR